MKGAKSKAAAAKDSKLSVKKRGVDKASSQPAKKTKAGKDTNKPKRPASAFFVFMDDFRVQYKKKHPGEKKVAVIGKAGGAKWKSLSEAEKAPFVAKAAKLKDEYDRKMVSYNNKESVDEKEKVEEEEDEEESDKSKSEENDDEDDEGSEEEGDDEADD